ncbi:hypothetical protein [Hyphococcus sp.]|uniref:hypothetical protein n=1 Tax=Hyphococcus sp. TaxID=2038636 RepID=UPI0035C6C08A
MFRRMLTALAAAGSAAFASALAQDREFVPTGPIQPLQKGTTAQTANPGRTVVTSSSMVGEGAGIGRSWGTPIISNGRREDETLFVKHQMKFVNPDRQKSATVRISCFALDGKPAAPSGKVTLSPLSATYHVLTTSFNEAGVGEGWCYVQASLPIIATGQVITLSSRALAQDRLETLEIPYFVLAK